MRNYFFGIVAILVIVGCGDDDGPDRERVPPELLREQVIEDDAAIQEFLQTHTYNYEEFENPPAGFDFKIKIVTLAGENADKISFLDLEDDAGNRMVKSAAINVSSFEFNLSEEENDVPHTYYYLEIREGRRNGMAGPSPSIADSVLVRYEGRLLDSDSTFDGSFNNPVWFDLAQIQAPLAGFRGFTEAMVNFNSGGEVVDNGDGTISVQDYGIGMMIFPSGLSNFNTSQPGIPRYSPMIFLIDLYSIKRTDHDGDGIPSIQEDVNGNGFLFDDNTDSEEERRLFLQPRANFQDSDDDQDEIPTRDEIIVDALGNITFLDLDLDGTPDYLDNDN